MGRKKIGRRTIGIPNFIIMNRKWVKGFMLSHVFGWTTAFFQTFWIVYEIRKYAKLLGTKKSIELGNDRRNQN
jgi:hypothetical protein